MTDRLKQIANQVSQLLPTMTSQSSLPSWDELKTAPGTDYKCAWGLFDKQGQAVDQVGTLNLLTPERVLAAAKSEIKSGESVSLNWGMENVKYPGFQREPMKQTIIDLNKIGFCGRYLEN